MARKEQGDKNFESALEDLEQVVEQLESGDLALKIRWRPSKKASDW